MFTFKKFSKNLKRMVSVALCCLILSGLFVVPAMAAQSNITGVFTHVLRLDGSSHYVGVTAPHTGGTGSYSLGSSAMSPGTHNLSYEWNHLPNIGVISGAVGVYYSFYIAFPGATSLSVNYDLSQLTPRLAYDTSSENARFIFPADQISGSFVKFSAPVLDGYLVSPGWVCKARTPYFESINPITYFWFDFNHNGEEVNLNYTYTSNSASPPLFYSPSMTVILSDVVTLDWMEGLADSLTGDSDILTAMYADVMSILNDMYSVMQDQLAVERAIKGYFEELLPLIESIDGTTSNIYSLLQTQFQLLRTLIATESDDIQAAIEQQTDDLIEYFDTVFSNAVGDMPEKTDDLNQSVGDVSDAESNYQSTATQRFDQLTDTFSGGFSGGTLAGVTLAATLFTRVWNALGDYVIVYTWPLFLGLCLVILGRISRLSGGQSSSEKHRGDSDA